MSKVTLRARGAFEPLWSRPTLEIDRWLKEGVFEGFTPAAEKRGELAPSFTRSLIGAGKQRRRHGNADLPCSFAVYHLELSLGAADHRATEFV